MAESPLPGIDPADLEAVRSQFTEATYREREYAHLGSEARGIERGTVLIDGTAVRGYPSTPRVLVLESGVPRYFDDPVAIEEKLNGYNVRIAHVGEPLAFTRSGQVCPYTTRIAQERLDLEAFFAHHPEKMLCAEFVGPENPYTSHDYDDVDGLEPRVFDVRDRESGRSMPVAERRSALERVGFPQPELFGTLEPEAAPEAVRDAIQALEEHNREGVVMQSADGRDLLKYTTGSIHRQDLSSAFALPFDYGRDFLFSRLIREGFQVVEFGEDEAAVRERAHEIGEAILEPMVETIRAVQGGEVVGERHTVRGSPGAVGELLIHLEEQGLGLEIEVDREVGDERVVEFVKIANTTRDTVEHFLEGGTIDQ
ncbi:MAG: RNA ligase [Halodesulfurarchaeum sp.]